MVVTAAVCILHYAIRLRFEALSCSGFQNISNGRCVVGACSAAARKSREGREPSLISVCHHTFYCIFRLHNTEMKIKVSSLRRQNSAWPALHAGSREIPEGPFWQVCDQRAALQRFQACRDGLWVDSRKVRQRVVSS